MSLQQWVQIAEIASSVAVIVSLIYVGVQVRHNTRALKATTYNAVTANSVAILSPMSGSAEFAEFMHRAQSSPGSLTPAERLRLHAVMLTITRHWDNLYYQFRGGTLDREMWLIYNRTMSRWLEHDVWRAWFRDNPESYSENLRLLVRERLDTPPSRVAETRS